MRSPRLAALLLFGGFVAAGCNPKYPNCKKDEDCNRDKQRGEFCVNQLCQKCRDDKDCEAGTYCNKGRCDAIEGWCKDDKECGDGVCVDHRCQPCKDDGQCGPGGKCRSGKCVRATVCKTDEDCPDGQDCKNGVCVGGAVVADPDFKAPCALASVLFDFNESVLTTEATPAIDANLACMNKVGRGVQLVGRSDPRGTEEYNLLLSERRAQSVKDRLGRLGLDAARANILPKGELEAKGTDESGWAQDRRVDFEWMK